MYIYYPLLVNKGFIQLNIRNVMHSLISIHPCIHLTGSSYLIT